MSVVVFEDRLIQPSRVRSPPSSDVPIRDTVTSNGSFGIINKSQREIVAISGPILSSTAINIGGNNLQFFSANPLSPGSALFEYHFLQPSFIAADSTFQAVSQVARSRTFLTDRIEITLFSGPPNSTKFEGEARIGDNFTYSITIPVSVVPISDIFIRFFFWRKFGS